MSEDKKNSYFEDLRNVLDSVEVLHKNKDNPFFKSKYVELNQVLEQIKPILKENNFLLIQKPEYIEATAKSVLKTIIWHTSGEKLEGSIELVTKDNDPQKLGSAITYMRRYSLVAMLGMQSEDDDGNSASGKEVKKEEPKKTVKNTELDRATEEQLQQIRNLVEIKGSNIKSICDNYKVKALPELSNVQATHCIGILKKKEDKINE